MAGVGKLLKQAQKMQKQIETMQASLETQVIDVSSGGGAVHIKINGAGKFLAFKLDPEFLKEEAKLVEETVLNAVQEAATKAKALNEGEMQKISSAFQMPGMF
ncbi:MAG: YbaB/EbfC family nucleoid-associated protein [Lacunisphaera sp.]|nr:YbaB/EbfC family nucleoid-associated protein [Lacunisphaera sp.]